MPLKRCDSPRGHLEMPGGNDRDAESVFVRVGLYANRSWRGPALARDAADRRGFGGRRGLRHYQTGRRFGWSDDHASPRHHRGRDHALAVAKRIIAQISPQAKQPDRCDNPGNDHRDHISTLVFSGHCLVLYLIHGDVFTGIGVEIVNSNQLDFSSPARSSRYATQRLDAKHLPLT
jgi:hypothetical protein